MRAAGIMLLGLLSVGIASVAGSEAAGASRACAGRLPNVPATLPAPVTITTSCGRFRVGRDGRVRRTSSEPLPLPPGAAWWPSSGVWEIVERGHLVVGRGPRRLWRSHARFPLAYALGTITLGPRTLAFSSGRTPQLYLARLGGRERRLASGEFPLGWSGDSFYTRRRPGGELLLRGRTGALRQRLARRTSSYAYEQASGALYFLAQGTLVRAQGGQERGLASLRTLRFSPTAAPQLEPLGQLLALRGPRRLVVLRADGSRFATTRIPHGRSRVDGFSSSITAAPAARAVAFAATLGNTASGSHGSETVYLLRPGQSSAVPLYREQLEFAVCERQAELAWHRRWLLYSASEGSLVVIDTRGSRRAIDLSGLVSRLPGTGGGEGHRNFSAHWAAEAS
jgi:hypothetical protein